jgi:hypothetical protein
MVQGAIPRLRSALAEAWTKREAKYIKRPCEEMVRALLRKRVADWLASLDHDRVIATTYGITP